MRDVSGNLEGPPSTPREQPSFEELMRMATRSTPVGQETDQWRLLLDAVASLSSGQPLEETLSRLLQVAAELTGARYGALTLVEWDEHPPLRLSYTTRGVTRSSAEQLREVPGGHGLQGPLVELSARRTGDALDLQHRLPQPVEPGPAHLSMEARVRVGDRLFGTLHLSEKLSGPGFSEEDERLVATLAGAAGVAIENARLHEQGARRERWLTAASELFRCEPDNTALQIVADWARELCGADAAWVVAGPGAGALLLRAVSGFDADSESMASLDFTTSLSQCAAASGRPLKVKSLATHCRGVDVVGALGAGAAGPALIVPIGSSTELRAVVTVAWQGDYDPARHQRDAALVTVLAEQAPLVLHVARSRQDEQRLAVLQDRDRIARDLHDLVIQQLFALGLELQGISWLHDPDEIARRLDRTTDEIDATIRDIRRTIFSLGSISDDSDPRSAINELVERAARTMKLRPTLSFRGPVKAMIGSDLLPDVLAVLSEALSNAVRHAHASSCAVEVSAGDEVTVRVADDGTGIPDSVQESGLANVRRRAQRRGGHLAVTSSPDHGTSLVWSVPLS